MEIQQLRHFIAVVEHGSIGSAAEFSNITQSGLSRSLKNLENSIGLPLFRRGHRGVQPTPFGESLIPRARLIINERDRAMEELRAVRLAKSGTIKIGITPNFSLYFAPDAVVRFSKERPNVDFIVTTGSPQILLDLILSGDLDFAVTLVTPGLELDEDLASEVMFESASVVLASRGHPLSSQTDLSIEQLSKEKWGIIDSPAFRTAFVNFFESAGCDVPRQVVRTNSVAFLLNCAERHDLLTVLPRVTTRNRLATNLVKLDAPAFGALTNASFVYRADELLMTPAMKNAMHAFRAEAAKLFGAET